MTITIPSPAKVFTLAGAFSSGIPQGWLFGELWRSPSTVEAIDYPNTPSNANAAAGAAAVNTILNSYTPSHDVIIYGHSMGAQVIYKWLREYGPTSTIPTSKVLFVSTGNPERKCSGVSVVRPGDYPAAYPGTGGEGVGYGLPAAPTPYTVIDLARQYDFYADHPATLTNRVAMQNIGSILCPIHRDYNTVGFNDPRNVVTVEGNVTYVTVPTFPLKMLRFSGWRGREYVTRRDQELRPVIESAYVRAAGVPMPDYWGEKSGDRRQTRTVLCSPGRRAFWSGLK